MPFCKDCVSFSEEFNIHDCHRDPLPVRISPNYCCRSFLAKEAVVVEANHSIEFLELQKVATPIIPEETPQSHYPASKNRKRR